MANVFVPGKPRYGGFRGFVHQLAGRNGSGGITELVITAEGVQVTSTTGSSGPMLFSRSCKASNIALDARHNSGSPGATWNLRLHKNDNHTSTPTSIFPVLMGAQNQDINLVFGEWPDVMLFSPGDFYSMSFVTTGPALDNMTLRIMLLFELL